MTIADEPLSLSSDGPLAILRIARPAKRNALNLAILEAWPGVLAAVAADAAIRVLIVTGAAGGPFSAGADIDEFRTLPGNPAAQRRFNESFATALDAMAAFAKPAIAMIAGPCVGGGCGMALACDIRFADSTAQFGVTPAKLGLDYGIADTKRLVDAVGQAHAADLLFSGRLIDAAEAHAMGLINRRVAPDDLEPMTRDYARRIAANAASSLGLLKSHLQAIRAGQAGDDESSRQAFRDAFAGPDFAEGLAAFLAKRPPRFR